MNFMTADAPGTATRVVRRTLEDGGNSYADKLINTHQRYANTTPESLVRQAAKIGPNTATLVERVMRDRPHTEQGYRSSFGILSLARRYQHDRLEAACERALSINALAYSSVIAILKSGLDRAPPATGPIGPAPPHGNIRGGSYYQ